MKLVTLNLNFFVEKHGPWEKRKELVCGLLKKEKPDIMAFQAVRQPKGKPSQAHEIAAALDGYAHVLFHGREVHADGSVDGQAFVSRLPSDGTGHFELSPHPDNNQDTYRRFVYFARFPWEGKHLDFYNGHFSWVPEQNLENFVDTVPLLDSRGPAVLAGDFNAQPDSPSLELLRKAGWKDVWGELRPEEDGFTFESDRPSMRIDYFWLNREAWSRLKAVHLMGTESPDGRSRLSDHLGLVLSLK